MLIMYGIDNKTTINRNNNIIDLVPDCNIFEVYYKNVYMGYFHKSQLEKAIQEITNNGFYNGYNYDIRINNINSGKAV